ncbi:MFS general substrate transporter [Melanogaster broomeanus]|nr:MFS general substrate transporter [Melanogaster broomeanus]
MSLRRTSSNVASSENEPEKQAHALSTKEVDTGAQIVAGLSTELDPIESARVRRKIDFHILPMMCTLYWMQFMDKTTLGSAAILGIEQDTHLTTNHLNIFIWSIALICQAACSNFAGLFVCRFLLGMCEGSITAGFMIVSSMFYTRNEQTLRFGYWFLMSGTAQVISGFISFGSLHINTKGFAPWQWLMIITGILTLITAVVYWFFFPDSPTTAWFLTPSERVTAVRRLKTGVENKHFKKEQMIEALKDPKTWLFALFSAVENIPNSLTNQRQIIVSSFGFSTLNTTLLGCVDGFIEIATVWTGVTIVSRIPNSRAYVGAIYFVPTFIGVFMIEFLPWSNQIGLLFGVWLVDIGITGFVLSLSWLTTVTAGHTKRVTTNAIMLSAYCIGNAAGPFMWQSQYKPRNRIPWIVIGICYLLCAILLLVIRFMLARENARRDADPAVEEYEEFFIEKVSDDGKRVQVKVDKEFLDMTDRQNRDFRYAL